MVFFIYINLLSYLFISYKIYKMHGEGLLVSPAFIYLVFHGIAFILKPFLIYYAGFSFAYRHIGFSLDARNFNFTILVENRYVLAQLCVKQLIIKLDIYWF